MDPRHPEHPHHHHLDPDELLDEIVPEQERPRAGKPWVKLGAGLLIVAAIAALVTFTDVERLLNVNRLVEVTTPLRTSPWGLPVVLAIFVLGGVLAAPVTWLIVATGLAFGAVRGVFYAAVGVLASAAVVYLLGRVITGDLVDRLSRGHARAIGERLGAGGLFAAAGIRFVPVAPFSVVNLVAGAVHMRFRDYLVGTALGMAPLVVGLAVFGESLLRTLAHPEPVHLLAMLVIAGLILAFGIWIRRHLRRRKGRLEAHRTEAPGEAGEAAARREGEEREAGKAPA